MSSTAAYTVSLSDRQITYQVVKRKRQKHINIRVTHDGTVIVSAPLMTEISQIAAALKQKERWIRKHIDTASQNMFDPLVSLPINGVDFGVSVEIRPAIKTRLILDPGNKTVRIVTSNHERFSHLEILQSKLRKYARELMQELTSELSKECGIGHQRLYIRNQRTRWGSSSGRGNLSFNWRIILTPPQIQRYLAVHELAHQIHMNHSKEFWKLVEMYCPGYQKHNDWLRKHSFLLAVLR